MVLCFADHDPHKKMCDLIFVGEREKKREREIRILKKIIEARKKDWDEYIFSIVHHNEFVQFPINIRAIKLLLLLSAF